MTDKSIVLVVEDDPLQRMMACDIVEDAGLSPIYAATADDAIKLLESRTDIRILLTDVDTPGSMDGLRLAEVVASRWPPIQIMVLSGHLLPEDTGLPTRSRFFNKPYAPGSGDPGFADARALMSAGDDERFMREAIRIATENGRDPSLAPIGCVIVRAGQILAARRNHVEDHHDATAHAEIEAIRAAGASFDNGELRGATLYSTLQPCGMCTMASIWSKVGRVVYGAGRDDVHQMYFEARHIDTLDFIRNAYRNDIAIEGGVLREECAALYYRPWDKLPIKEQANL
jgi:tRNA(adenine34) deaminase